MLFLLIAGAEPGARQSLRPEDPTQQVNNGASPAVIELLTSLYKLELAIEGFMTVPEF